MAEITELWERLEAWARNNAPAMLEDLNPGATDAQTAELESTIPRLPVVESLVLQGAVRTLLVAQAPCG